MRRKTHDTPSIEDVLTLMKTKIANLEERVSFLESEVEGLQQGARHKEETAGDD
jgi:uncharacterized small protein (DUF1192 family)